MGKNYDSAVMVAGLTGFAMGSTSNAMANMNSVTEKYVYSRTAFFIVPIVGSLFIDFINIGIIYGFISFLSNAMANMNSVTEKYVYSRTAFFIVPIVGSLFIDFINIGIIYGFISFLS